MFRNVHITYFVHGTTIDNEQHLATGWFPGELSERGGIQSHELKEMIKHKKFKVIFCSDLKRAVDSAHIVFGGRIHIIEDKRLRECDYGDLTNGPSKLVYTKDIECINKPFPNGESYKDVEKRMRDFLKDLSKNYPRKRIAIVAHRAPQFALEVITNKKTWEQAINEDWRHKAPKEWQPGWEYVFKA